MLILLPEQVLDFKIVGVFGNHMLALPKQNKTEQKSKKVDPVRYILQKLIKKANAVVPTKKKSIMAPKKYKK